MSQYMHSLRAMPITYIISLSLFTPEQLSTVGQNLVCADLVNLRQILSVSACQSCYLAKLSSYIIFKGLFQISIFHKSFVQHSKPLPSACDFGNRHFLLLAQYPFPYYSDSENPYSPFLCLWFGWMIMVIGSRGRHLTQCKPIKIFPRTSEA